MKPFIRYTGLAALCAAIAAFFSLFLSGCSEFRATGGLPAPSEKLHEDAAPPTLPGRIAL